MPSDMNDQSSPIIELREVTRSFMQGSRELIVLRGISTIVKRKEILGLTGPSGSGKSTMLHIAGLLEKPTSGEVSILGQIGSVLGDDFRSKLRRENIGFVYQFHHLLPEFSALENVMLPQIIARSNKEKARTKASELLNKVGLYDRLEHKPGELSGGEQQRVAVARALANNPKLLLADEPTGNLDPATASEIIDLLLRFVAENNMSAIVATHNYQVSERLSRVLVLKDGRLQSSSS